MNCRICNSTGLTPVLDLGNQPWCNNFLTADEVGKEPFYPLRVVLCDACRAAQLDYTVPKEVMFSDHTYVSGITKSLSDHFGAVAEEVDRRFFSDTEPKRALDIGSNDGTQLRHFKRLSYEVLGVESSRRVAQMANDSGIPTLNEFFNLDVAQRTGMKFHVINAAGVFFHLEELHSVTEGIREALREDGVFIVQFLYMKRIMENLAFDQIYHEHLLYYNLATLEVLLKQHALQMFDAYLSPIHGGSAIGFITHARKRPPSRRLIEMRKAEDDEKANSLDTYQKFAQDILRLKETNVAYLDQAKGQGKSIFGFGAPAKGTTLLNYFEIGPSQISYLVERNPLRKGLFCPGAHIPIVLEQDLPAPPDVYYVLAWNFRDEILARNRALIEAGVEFYFPIVPRPVGVYE